MDHTVVVLTHAHIGFENRSLETFIADLPNDEGHVSVTKAISLKKFLKEEVRQHVMAVNNNCKREYERVKQRDALIELIDVMLLKNGGKCFKNKYYDKAEKKLKEREEKEEKLKEDLMDKEIKKWDTANNQAKFIANGIAVTHLLGLQLEGMEKEKNKPTTEVINSIKPRFDDIRKALSVLLQFIEDDPNEPLNNIIDGMVVKCSISRIDCIEDEESYKETKREAQEKQEHEKEEEEIRKKNEAQRLIIRMVKLYPKYRKRQAMLQRHKEESKTEKQKFEEMMDNIRDIRKSLIERQHEIDEITKDEKTRLGEHISREGCDMKDFELALGYAREVALIIVEEHFKAVALPQLKDPGDETISTMTKDVKNHLATMIKMLEKMKEFNRQLGAKYYISDKIIDESFHKCFSVMKFHDSEQNKKYRKAVKQDWQEKAFMTSKEEIKKGRPAATDISLSQYEMATAYARLLALYGAEKIIDHKEPDEITTHISNLTRSELGEKEASGDKTKGKTKSFITVTTEDLVEKVENELKFSLMLTDEGTTVLKLLGELKSWNSEPKLHKLAKESLTELMFFKLMEMGHESNLAQARRTYRMQLLTSLASTDHVTETQNYDLVKLYVVHVAEYLVETHLRLVRAEEIKQEDNSNFNNSIRVVTEKMKQYLGRNSPETIQYFTRYITHEGKLNSIEKISKYSLQTWGRKIIIELENDFCNQLRLQQVLDDWVNEVANEENHRKGFIEEQIDILTDKIKSLTPEYAKSKTAAELREMARTDYKHAAQDLTPKVREELSKEGKKFFSDEKIGNAIKDYAKFNHDTLIKLTPPICFPAEATVIEEKHGEVKVCELRVGDRILTAQTNGQLIYQDVFMFGKHSVPSILRSISLTFLYLIHWLFLWQWRMKDFPRGTNPKLGTPTYYLAKFSRKLYENKEKKTERGKGHPEFYCMDSLLFYLN